MKRLTVKDVAGAFYIMALFAITAITLKIAITMYELYAGSQKFQQQKQQGSSLMFAELGPEGHMVVGAEVDADFGVPRDEISLNNGAPGGQQYGI